MITEVSPFPATGTVQEIAAWMRRNALGIPKESWLPLTYPAILDTARVRGRERAPWLVALARIVEDLRLNPKYGRATVIEQALEMLPDEFEHDARPYISGAKDIANLIQQLKNIKRDGLPASLTRVTVEHIVLTYCHDEFDDAAHMYKRASHAVRKKTCAFFNGLFRRA